MNWTSAQQERYRELLLLQEKGEVRISFWNSDAHGRPANGGEYNLDFQAKPGLVQEIKGSLEICKHALHASDDPLRWKGYRVWMVALHGEMVQKGHKLASLKREIIGEVLPEDCICNPRIGARLGRKDLFRADLSWAYLTGANLSIADLSGAYLSRAYLFGANLSRADLSGANLSGANLPGANLSEADLSGADLSGANLSRAKRYINPPDGWRIVTKRYINPSDGWRIVTNTLVKI